MHEEVPEHIEFWTQFGQYLKDNGIQIRLKQTIEQLLKRRYS